MNGELIKLKDIGKLLPKPLPKSYPALRDFVKRYKHVFKPRVLGKGKGKRYYIPRENVDRFLKEFWKGRVKK
jgi:hypothetical protein